MLSDVALMVLGGAFAGGFISGLAGFGTGLVALGIWLHVLAPATAATLVVVCSVASQAQTIPAIWHAIDRARIWLMLAGGLLGVPVGTRLLTHLDPAAFRLGMGVLLLAYSGFMLLSRFRARITWGGRLADGAVGFAGGILGGLAGLSGRPVAHGMGGTARRGQGRAPGRVPSLQPRRPQCRCRGARGLRPVDGRAGTGGRPRLARHARRHLAWIPSLPPAE